MINMLQLVIQLPLFAIFMPANVTFYMTMLLKIVKFKIVPTDEIFDALLGAKDYLNSSIQS